MIISGVFASVFAAGVLASALYFRWLRLNYRGGIARELERRAQRGRGSFTSPTDAEMRDVARDNEWADYQRYGVLARRWFWVSCLAVPAIWFFIGVAAVW